LVSPIGGSLKRKPPQTGSEAVPVEEGAGNLEIKKKTSRHPNKLKKKPNCLLWGVSSSFWRNKKVLLQKRNCGRGGGWDRRSDRDYSKGWYRHRAGGRKSGKKKKRSTKNFTMVRLQTKNKRGGG